MARKSSNSSLLGFVIIIGVIVAIVTWIIENIIGVIGIGLAGWGIYAFIKNKKYGIKSKVPAGFVITGLLVAIGWFALAPDKEVAEVSTEPSEESSSETSSNSTAPQDDNVVEEAQTEEASTSEEPVQEETQSEVSTTSEAEKQDPLEEPRESPAAVTEPTITESVTEVPEEAPPAVEDVYYKNCTEVKRAGAAPIHKGEPGYSSKLDRDGDGIACDQ
jgi:hypothetical protein